jgi:hypothetical protein
VNTAASLRDALLFYPQYMLCLKAEGNPAYEFYPYGFMFPAFLLGTLYCIMRREGKAAIPLLWFSYVFLMMEFAPLRISPYYQPIHRLIRFLSIVSIPALLVVAYSLRQLFRGGRRGKLLALLVIAGLVSTSLHHAYRKSYCYTDSMSDARNAYDMIRRMPYKQIITDHEMKMALIFLNQLHNRDRFKSFEYDNPQYVSDSLVILGGARRPDIHHQYGDTFVRSHKPQNNWVKICEVQGNKEAWRKSNLVIYKIIDQARMIKKGE